MHKKIIIAGGGTGGHIFPALAIASALKRRDSDLEILFVGAKGKMEMEKVPQAGYPIRGIDIAGFNRSSLIKNIGLPFKLLKSFFQVRNIFNEFKPDAVLGVGGYSTFPVLKFAQAKAIPSFIHEANSFAGKSNMLLGKKATRVFTGTDGMEKFFPPEKILVTGNPVRKVIVEGVADKNEALGYFSLQPGKPTLLVIGGSLGARSINEAVLTNLDVLIQSGLQIIWQTGKSVDARAAQFVAGRKEVWMREFITDMQYAYSAADMVIARAGAMTVAEICVTRRPALFVPYPFAAEDHQTANALQLVNKKAAWMVKDSDVKEKGIKRIIELAKNEPLRNEMSEHLGALAITDADERVANEILNIISKK